jgi:hypothetical protein
MMTLADYEMLTNALDDPETFDRAGRMYHTDFYSAPERADSFISEEHLESWGFNADDLLTCVCNSDGEGDDNFVIYDSSIHFPLFVDSSSCYFAV